MSILIKGMEMPETCEDCEFHRYHSNREYVCIATPLFYPMNLANSKGIRKDFCPLEEVPEYEDAVRKQELLNEYYRLRENWNNADNAVDKCISVLKDLSSVTPKPEQRWIPVTERSPEEKDAGILKKLGTEKRSEYVLATVEVKGERMTVTACTHDGKWNWNMKYAFPDFNVVAWMPLPEPYQPKEKNK